MSITVIKLGGSLLRCGELPVWLETIQAIAKRTNIIIVPGGGEFADKVRETQGIHSFSQYTAHQMALLAMCQYGYLLAEKSINTEIVNNIKALPKNFGNKIPQLWVPMDLIDNKEAIPANWHFTSDSIALWLAIKLAADRLVLVKPKNLDNSLSIEKHIKNNDIDVGFSSLINGFSGDLNLIGKNQHYFFANSFQDVVI